MTFKADRSCLFEKTFRKSLTAKSLFGLCALALVVILASESRAQEKCGAKQDGSTWTLERPPVNSRITECGEISVQNDDYVTVSAGGCVHTPDGWKNFVYPRGQNSDRLYSGLVWIPGATLHGLNVPLGTALAPITGAIGHTFLVAGLQDAQFIRVGYAADPEQYQENNYPDKDKDNGRPRKPPKKDHGNDCSGGFASVTITVEHGGKDKAGLKDLASFDVVSDRQDDNGLLLSPSWNIRWNRTADTAGDDGFADPQSSCDNFPYRNWFLTNYGVKSPCSAQPSFDVPWRPVNFKDKFNLNNYVCWFGPCLGRLHGHVNWAPVSMQGLIYWGDHATDDDLDLFLVPVDAQGPSDGKIATKAADSVEVCRNPPPEFVSYCEQNPNREFRAVALEMKYQETVAHFEVEEWGHLREAIDNLDDNENGPRFLDGNMAIVSGLLGLDCVHDCHVEIHPIYSLAIRLPDRTASGRADLTGIEHDDAWMVMVRNSGGEGFCSQDYHFLDRESFTLRLPPPRTYTGTPHPRIMPKPALNSNAGDLEWEDITPPGSRDALILITLKAPEEGSRGSGIIHVCWEEPCALRERKFHKMPRPLKPTGTGARRSMAAQASGEDHQAEQAASPVVRRKTKTPEDGICEKKAPKKEAVKRMKAGAPPPSGRPEDCHLGTSDDQPCLDRNPIQPRKLHPQALAMEKTAQPFQPREIRLTPGQRNKLNAGMKRAKKDADMKTLKDFCALFGKVHADSTVGKLCSRHGEIGVFGEVLRLQRVPVTLGGIGGRFSFELYNPIALEAETSFTFPRSSPELFSNVTSQFTAESSARTAVILGGGTLRSCGDVSGFVTVKGGITFIAISDVTASAGFVGALDPLRSSSWHRTLYGGGGIQFNLKNLALRLETGDLIYFSDGANHNLRVTFGPLLRF